MAGTGKAWLRREYYVRQRLAGSPAGLLGESPAEHHKRILREFRGRKVEQTPRRDGPAGLGPAPPPGPNWEAIGPFAVRNGQGAGTPVVAGRVPDLVVSDDGQRVYAATSNGGVWRSADAGRTWQAMSDEFDLDPERQSVDSLAHGAIALVDRGGVGSDILYVGTGEGHPLSPASPTFFGVGMLRSDDGGTTWHQENSNPDLTGRSVYAMAVDPTDSTQVLAATSRGVYRRGPATDTWVRESLPAPAGAGSVISGLAVGTRGGATIFFVTTAGGRIFSSTAVNTWTTLPSLPAPAIVRTTLACSASDPPVVYAMAADNVTRALHGVYRLDDGAATWRRVGGVPGTLLGNQGWYDQAVAVDPTDPNFVYVGGSTEPIAGEHSAALYRCQVRRVGANYTATSTRIGGSVHADIHALLFRPGSSRELWVGCDGGVFVSNDARLSGDRVFAARNTGLSNLSLMGLGHHPTEEAYAFCGAQDCGGLRYDGHEAWDHQQPGDGGASIVHWANPNRVLNVVFNTSVRRLPIDGARYLNTGVSVALAASETSLFYPPMVGTPPSATAADANLVALGAERPYVSATFGGGWVRLNARGPMGGANVTALAFASPTRLWAGWADGHVAHYDRVGANPLVAGSWSRIDTVVPAPGEARPVTAIAIDPTDATGMSIYITLGGPPGGGPRVRRFTGGAWTIPAGAVPSSGVAGRLLDAQHNAIVVDPAHPAHLYAGADIGVWRSINSGDTWEVFSHNLPDASVLDLDILPAVRVLRATTHGRGVFEIPLDKVQRGVELVLRANPLDQRRRDARSGVATPSALGHSTTFEESPDIYVEAPDENGRYTLPPGRMPDVVELLEQVTGSRILSSAPGTPTITRVHVVVRNRGVTSADDVRVSLLVGPKGQQLPPSYKDFARGGAFTEANGWAVAGTTTAHGLRTGRHAVVTLPLSSESLPPETAALLGQDYLLLALVHHADDPFPTAAPADTTDPTTLVTACRHSAMKLVTVASGARRAAPAGGSGLLVPMAATLLGHRRLSSVITDLGAKVATPTANVHPVERRVLAMATAARAGLEAGPKPAVDPTLAGHAVGSFALLGSLGFELPGYTSAFLPGGTWVAQTLHRGTGDQHMSMVAVSATEVPLRMAKLGIPATSGATRDAVRAFASGMLAGGAAGVALSPQLADLLAQETNADWSSSGSSRGARALEHHLRRLYLGGPDAPIAPWLPQPGQVPNPVWEHYAGAIEATFTLPASREHGFGAFEKDFDPGYRLNAARLGRGYALMRDDTRIENWGFWSWYGLIAPVFVMPSIAFAFSRLLPHSKAFVEGGDVGERAVFEALAMSMGLGSLAPFVYSMMLWSKVDEHTEAFVTALLMGLARLGLVTTALATSGDEGQGAGIRWGLLFPPLAGADAYATFRAALDPGRHPGNAKVFGLQTVPAVSGLTTLGLAGLARLITGDSPTDSAKEATFWSITLISGVLAAVAAGFPAAALANGRGWRSWFLRDTSHLPLLSSVAHAGIDPLSPTAAARVFEPAQLWAPSGGAVTADNLRYPAGARPLLKMWWEGDGDLTVKLGESGLTFRNGATETVVDLPAGAATPTAVVAKLQADLTGLKAELIGEDIPSVPLPRPKALSDLGDAAPHEAAQALRTGFVRVPRHKGQAMIVRQSPRVEQSVTAGRVAGAVTPYALVPADAVVDDLGTGMRDAADLASLLLIAGAPTLGDVRVSDARAPELPAPEVGEVMQVFRRWNLDERRLDEWRSLMTGHGATAAPADPMNGTANRMLRTQPSSYTPQNLPAGREIAEAMGWLPLWRAWLRVAALTAATPAANVGSNSTAGNPTVTFPGGGPPRRPRNIELTEGVRFLLDLGAT